MRPALLRLSASIAAAALVVGCTGSDGSDGGRDGGPAASTSTTFPTPAGPTLDDAGAAPRTALRLHLTEGTTARVSYTTDLSVTQATATTTSQLDPPPVAQTVAYRVGRVDATGAEVTFSVTAVDVAEAGTSLTPAAVLLLQDDLKDLVGIAGRGHLSDRGHLDRIAFQLPSGLSTTVRSQVEALEGQLGDLVPTLPVEAVGVGASWQATDTTTVGGVTTDRTTTYELTAVDGDTVSYASTTTYATEAQDVDLSGLPGGTTARLVTSDVGGTARGTMDLASPAHTVAAEATGTQVLDLVTGSAAPVRLSQRIRLATRVRAVS